jgi:hypothetical protein
VQLVFLFIFFTSINHHTDFTISRRDDERAKIL